MTISKLFKAVIFPFLVPFGIVFGLVWTFAEPLGLTQGFYLWGIIVVVSLAITGYWGLILKIIEEKTESANLSARILALEQQPSYCCVKQQDIPVCPLGVTRIIDHTEDTIKSSLMQAKRRFRWLGLSAFNVVHNNQDVMEAKKDVEYSFKILSPDDVFLQNRVDDYYGNVRGKIDSKKLIDLSNELIGRVSSTLNTKVVTDYHHQMPSFRLILVDDTYAYVSFYERGVDALRSFQLELTEDDRVEYPLKRWFDAYYEKFKITEEAFENRLASATNEN